MGLDERSEASNNKSSNVYISNFSDIISSNKLSTYLRSELGMIWFCSHKVKLDKSTNEQKGKDTSFDLSLYLI